MRAVFRGKPSGEENPLGSLLNTCCGHVERASEPAPTYAILPIGVALAQYPFPGTGSGSREQDLGTVDEAVTGMTDWLSRP